MKQIRKRLFIDAKTSVREREKMIYLAVENGCNTLVFSLDDMYFKSKFNNKKYIKLINNYAINIEAGGRDFSLLIPRQLFLTDREMFRMDQGSRKADHHFCPTNPKTISIVMDRAQNFFTNALQKVTPPRIFHLLPDENSICFPTKTIMKHGAPAPPAAPSAPRSNT